MLIKRAFDKILRVSILFVIVLLFFFLKSNNSEQIEKDISKKEFDVFFTSNNYIVKTTMYSSSDTSIEEKIKNYLETIIIENNKNSLLPDYFKPVIPVGTKVLDVKVSGDILKIYFSKEFNNATEDQYKKMLECITYTALEQENILGVEIYVDKEMIRYIPSTSEVIPTVLDKDIGINKKYEITSNVNVKKIYLYYYLDLVENRFLIPVTKYINSDKDKLFLIIDQLKSFMSEADLISFVGDKTKLSKYEIDKKTINIYFEEIEEDAIDQIVYSVFENFDVDKINLFLKENKFMEKNKKDIEN